MKIRLAKKEDAQALEDLVVLVGGEEWRALAQEYITAMFEGNFRRPTFFVAVKDDAIIGCAAFSEEMFTTNIWGISWVNVRPDHERQGIGRQLVEVCMEEIKQRAGKRVTVILNTYPGKTGLYDKTGFMPAGNDHAGGCLMVKYVGGETG